MELVSKCTLIIQSLKAISKTDRLTAGDAELLPGVKCTKDLSCTTQCMGTVYFSGLMVAFTTELFKRVKSVEKDFTSGLTGRYTTETSIMIYAVDLEFFTTQTENASKELGKTGKSTARDFTSGQQGRSTTAYT